jgi:group I intron endonuclease
VNLYESLCEHLWQNGSKSNILLQRAIAKHGLENFEYFVISFVINNTFLVKEEQKYMDMVPSNLRYNFSPTAGSCLGVVRSAETKAAISEALKGNTNSLGVIRSAETKATMSEAHKGEKNPIFGKFHSAEAKAAISAAKSKAVYVYDENNVLVGSFPSHTAAGAFLDVHPTNVSRLINTGRRNRKGFLIYSAPLT